MRKLLRRFKKFLTLDTLKLTIFFLLLIGVRIVDVLTNISAFAYKFVIPRYRELTILLLVIISPAAIVGYINETVPTYKGGTQYSAEMYIYTNCHEMSNNFIVAEDKKIHGFVRADKKNIDKILAVLAQYDVENRDEIVSCLQEFRNQDYHSAAWLHNLCWAELDGKVGYAIGLKDRYKRQ